MAEVFHFPPDLMNLLVDTIPRLNKSKKDLIGFFLNCGVEQKYLQKYVDLVERDRDALNKYEMTRDILISLNQAGESMLGVRRRLLQRVVCFDSFDVCWEADRIQAKANVAEIAKIVKMKDTVTRFENIAENKRSENMSQYQKKIDLISKKKNEFERIKNDMMSLFAVENPQNRGKALEGVLNRLFSFFKIGIHEAFCIYDDASKKCYEQIDGVIEISNNINLVEMKWEKEPIGVDSIARFLGRMYTRADVEGIFISYSGFAETGIKTANEALSQKTITLVKLQDIITILDMQKDLRTYFETRIRFTKIYKNSFYHVDVSELQDLDFATLFCLENHS